MEASMTAQTLVQGVEEAGRWEQAIYAFLAEKERRSGSMRTVESYSRMLYRFFGAIGKTPDAVVAPEIFHYAHGVGLSGSRPRLRCAAEFLVSMCRTMGGFRKDSR